MRSRSSSTRLAWIDDAAGGLVGAAAPSAVPRPWHRWRHRPARARGRRRRAPARRGRRTGRPRPSAARPRRTRGPPASRRGIEVVVTGLRRQEAPAVGDRHPPRVGVVMRRGPGPGGQARRVVDAGFAVPGRRANDRVKRDLGQQGARRPHLRHEPSVAERQRGIVRAREAVAGDAVGQRVDEVAHGVAEGRVGTPRPHRVDLHRVAHRDVAGAPLRLRGFRKAHGADGPGLSVPATRRPGRAAGWTAIEERMDVRAALGATEIVEREPHAYSVALRGPLRAGGAPTSSRPAAAVRRGRCRNAGR